MNKILQLLCGLVLTGNFVILAMYGDTLRSTHLFIVTGTVFYPFAYANLTLGVLVLGSLIYNWFRKKG